MTELYEYNNHIMIYSGYPEPEAHKHAAAHVFLSENKMRVNVDDDEYFVRGIAIPSGKVHSADNNGESVIVFLFDETTSAAEQIRDVVTLSDEVVSQLIDKFRVYKDSGRNKQDYVSFIQNLYMSVGIDELPRAISDERIKAAIYFINQRIGTRITCKEVASAVFMSESRFSHLFKYEMGITFVGFLQMRQLSYAYYLIINGRSITDAALDAGFSSTAHFSATHKRLFGLRATDISSDVEFYKIQ